MVCVRSACRSSRGRARKYALAARRAARRRRSPRGTRTMQRSDFRFLDRLRVRWAEVDMQKIVFNGHYLMYFDTAVAGYWRALALPYHDTMERLQGDLYVRKATLEYEGSARYDDQLEVGIRCARIGKSSLVFSAAVFRGEQRLVHGELVYVFADPATQTSRPVPAGLARGAGRLRGRRSPWSSCAAATGSALGADARRHPPGRVRRGAGHRRPTWSATMPTRRRCTRWPATASGVPVAGGRLLQAAPGVAQIGRMAALATVRGAGLGRAGAGCAAARGARTRRPRGDAAMRRPPRAAFYRARGFRPPWRGRSSRPACRTSRCGARSEPVQAGRVGPGSAGSSSNTSTWRCAVAPAGAGAGAGVYDLGLQRGVDAARRRRRSPSASPRRRPRRRAGTAAPPSRGDRCRSACWKHGHAGKRASQAARSASMLPVDEDRARHRRRSRTRDGPSGRLGRDLVGQGGDGQPRPVGAPACRLPPVQRRQLQLDQRGVPRAGQRAGQHHHAGRLAGVGVVEDLLARAAAPPGCRRHARGA